jgi:hypothetical protein
MLKNLFKNWRTTSAGLTMIVGGTVHLIFCIRAGTATEGVWTASILGTIGGVGLMFAGDSSASRQESVAVKTDVAKAIETGDTAPLKTEPPKTP